MCMTNRDKAARVRLVITDIDGVWTDTGVYYSANGEELKRFSIRDGMGVELLRNKGIPVAIITGEGSPSVIKRAEKLQITEIHLSIKRKVGLLKDICNRYNLTEENIAYIGDDVNDKEIMNSVGFSACPSDAMPAAKECADYICTEKGGFGAFREFADYILSCQEI